MTIRRYEVPLPYRVETRCPPDLPREDCYELARVHANLSSGVDLGGTPQMVPSTDPGTWALVCRSCGATRYGLGLYESHALEGVRAHLTPCCLDSDPRAEPTVYERREPRTDPCTVCGSQHAPGACPAASHRCRCDCEDVSV